MKKNSIAAILAVSALLGTFAYHVLADAQGGATVVAPDPVNGKTLNTVNTTLTTTEKNTLQTNLGISSAGGGLIVSGTPSTPAIGNLVVSATSLNVYLTATSGLMIKSGTATTF